MYLFRLTVLPQINCKFILVTGDSDCTCPYGMFIGEEEINILLKNEKIIHWFCQNLVVKHPKLSQIPIGLDYHTISSNFGHQWSPEQQLSPIDQENELLEIQDLTKPLNKRIPKCYSNFHLRLHKRFGNPRKRAIETINPYCIFYEPNAITRKQTWINQSEYAFVVSPPGNGLDCHRTWEALILGCIVIVEKSPLDSLYQDLPVLIVENFKDISPKLLEDTINKFINQKFNLEKLELKYWTNEIEKYKQKSI